MLQKIIAFFMSIIAFLAGLFGINLKSEVIKDLSYGTEQRQVLDLYLPKNAGGEIGLVLFIHGGSWSSGDKSAGTGAAKAAAESYGYVGATMNYRLLAEGSDINVYDMLDDIDAALSKISSEAQSRGITLTGVALMGYSAGAHLAMLYAYSRADGAAVKPKAVISSSGPTDLTDEGYYNRENGDYYALLMSYLCAKSFTADSVSSARAELLAASPVTYAATAVPTLICHGEKDSIVPYSNAVTLDAALTAAGVEHELISYPSSDHDLAADPDAAAEAGNKTVEYIQTYLG